MIDYRPVIDHVMAAHGSENYGRTIRLMRWHGGRPNAHGCYEQAVEVDLARAGGDSAIAMASVTGRNHWICGYELISSFSSDGEAPNVWVSSGATTQDAALRDLARRVVPWFVEVQERRGSGIKEGTRRDAACVAEQLRIYAEAA